MPKKTIDADEVLGKETVGDKEMTEEKKTVDDDVKVLANLYRQFETELRGDMMTPPTSESLHALACTIMIERNRSKYHSSYGSGGAGSYTPTPAPTPRGEAPKNVQCPECDSWVPPTASRSPNARKPFYFECKKCNCWLNIDNDGTVKAVPKKRN